MFDGKYLDATGRNSVNDPIGSFKKLPHFVVHESLQSRPAAGGEHKHLCTIQNSLDHGQSARLGILRDVIVNLREPRPRPRGPRTFIGAGRIPAADPQSQ